MTGRPPLPKRLVRDRKVVICVSQAERRALAAWATRKGKPLAVAVRDVAMDQTREQP